MKRVDISKVRQMIENDIPLTKKNMRSSSYKGGGNSSRPSNWSKPMGGCDSEGNPITVAFGINKQEGHTLIGDGDRSEIEFRESDNHDHYGSGDGERNNGTTRGQYTGPGSN